MSLPLESAGCTGSHVQISAAVESLARDYREGALIAIRAPGERAKGEARAFEPLVRIAHEIPALACATTTWLGHEAVVSGPQEELFANGRYLLDALVADPETRSLTWSVIMTRVYPGEGERTLFCDPGYDVAAQPHSALFWVEPYEKPDWRKSQRYPTTTVLRVVERG